jgi:hypothetical protein
MRIIGTADGEECLQDVVIEIASDVIGGVLAFVSMESPAKD